MKYLLIVLLVLMTSMMAFAGGGWTQNKGSGYYKLSQWWIISDQHYTNTGEIDPNATRANFNTSIYAEHGITDRLTGILYFPFFSRAVLYEQVSATTGELLSEGDAINSIGDTDVSIKYGILKDGPVVLSATFTLGLPLGNSSGGRDGSLQTGDGAFNQMITVDISKSFAIGNTYPYLSVYTGFNNRTKGFSDEIRYGAEAGITIKNFTAIFRLQGISSLFNGDETFNSLGTSLFSNNREFLAFTPEVAYTFSDKWGISAGYGTAFSGKLIFASPTYSVGIFLKT